MLHPIDPRLDPSSELYAARPSTMSQPEWQARVDLTACYRMAALHGWDDHIYTHISLRVPDRQDAYLMNAFGFRFEEITASNLLLVNTQALLAPDDTPSGELEWAAILRKLLREQPDFAS